MLYLNAYGLNLPAADMIKKHNVRTEPSPAPGPNTKYKATIYAWREYKDFNLVVPLINEDGLAVADPQFQVAVAWANMNESGRPNLSFDVRYPIAETFSLEEVTGGVPELHAGTGDGGAPYAVFITDDDGEVISEIAHCGWVSNHITFCPIFKLTKLQSTPSPVSSGSVDIAVLAKEVARHLAVTVQAV